MPALMFSSTAGAVTNSEVLSQAHDGIEDWSNATIDAYIDDFSLAKSEYQAGLAYEEELQGETGTSELAREYWSGLFNPLQPFVESWVDGAQPAPYSLASFMSSSEFELAENDGGL
jgi:hypothetical protein